MTPTGLVGRVGGLAAVLGAGVIIGFAVAAPASADDSAAADSSPRTAAAEHSAGRASTGASHAAGPRRGTKAAARTGGAGPAASVSATRIIRSSAAVSPAPKAMKAPVLVAAAATAPAAQITPSPVRQSPGRPAAATPAVAQPVAAQPAAPAAASAPAAATVGSLFGDPRGRLITVYRGVHFALPLSPAFFIKKVTGTGTFTTDSVYDLKDVDQYDWNKFTGIVYSPLQHDKNSAMVGWRYNLTSQEFEIAPFYNVNKERILPNEQTEVISVPADGTFDYTVDYSGITISYGDKTVFKPYPPGLTPNIWTSSRVSGWFGGNEAAPRTLTYRLKLQ